ncbi:MAG TPA: allantoinase AllB [Pyrinomonadaceae bacterium]|nr:allantoinase AllB [Pyrinomonadaceae bacterium]
MSAPKLLIRSRQVVLPDSIDAVSIEITGGVITAINSYDRSVDCEVIDIGEELVVMPGLVDTHVHVNEPGRTEWEGFATATRAAAAGGVTTLIDMPLNSIPPTTTLAGFKSKTDAAEGQCHVDVGFWGGVVPGNTKELGSLSGAGVVGFKCFLVHSGVDEFPNVSETDLHEAMPELARLGAVLIVHAELPGPIETASSLASGEPNAYETFLYTRPRAAEDAAVALMVRLSREFNARVHIVHHSSADSLPLIAEAKAAGVSITAETCPHYLSFAAEDIPDGATEFKCCPPIRERENREQLWNAVQDGTIDLIVSDHSPCPPDMKLREAGDFLAAWGGISSLQLRLPVVWTEAKSRGFTLQDLTRWLCSAPARLVSLEKKKGAIALGLDADLVVWNPSAQFRVEGAKLEHRHKLTPYEGMTLAGKVETTFLRGQKIYDRGEFITEPRGILLTAKGRSSRRSH